VRRAHQGEHHEQQQYADTGRTAVLDDPILNRGVAFTAAGREKLGLTGRLPSAVPAQAAITDGVATTKPASLPKPSRTPCGSRSTPNAEPDFD
jgi:hypothetical protein